MKKLLLSLTLFAFIANASAQLDPRCPVFRRNNGNVGGCDARITLFYASCPTINYQIIGITSNGNLLPGLSFTTSPCVNGRVEVCVTGGNLPNTNDMTLLFSDVPGGSLLFACDRVPGGGPTPVIISSFNANRRNQSNVNLSWQTSLELNVKGFIIQRKTGNNFEDIATITAGNKINGATYTYTDINAAKSSSQYRLKVLDFNGEFSLSDIKNIKASTGNIEFLVFPNPTFGKASISFSDISATYDVEVLDNTGRIIRSVSVSGNNTAEFSNLPKGMHMIRVINKNTGEKATQKISVF